MSNITILNEQEPQVQSADRTKAVQVWIWDICIHQNLEIEDITASSYIGK